MPAHETVAEATIRAIVLGTVLAVVLGAANVYVGLSVGMTVSASIPAAVVSMGILRGIFRRGTILENNIAQTIASTGESLAAGAIFTIPALVMVGAWQDFKFWPTTFIIMFGGLLGVVFMVPLRRALIVERRDLTYPEGVACSQVLIAGQTGGSGIRTIAVGLGVGAVFKFLVLGIGLIRVTVEGAFAVGRSVFYFGANMSVMLVAVGYIVRLQVASQVFLGGVIAWIITLPLMGGYEGTVPPMDYSGEMGDTQIRYLGVGAMLIGGLYSIWNVRRGILGGLSGLRGAVAASDDESGGRSRTEQDMPLTALMSIFLFTALGTFALYDYLIGSVAISLLATFIMIVAAFIFVAVATYIVGLVGSSNSPVSGMTICALLMTAGIMLAVGIEGESAILATLGVAGVVCCAACTSGDIAQDLKTGILVGATPRRQQWTEVIGVVIPAFIFAPVMGLLYKSYGFGSEPGQLQAPQAALFANLAEGFFGDGDLPWNMISIGIGVGVGIIVLDGFLVRSKLSARAHIMPVAVGMYLPLALSVPIFMGGLIHYYVHRARNGTAEAVLASDRGVLFGSGLIAGEALIGIGLAIPISLGVTMPSLGGHWLLSLALFGAVIYGFLRIAGRSATP